jgi:rhamnulokinase
MSRASASAAPSFLAIDLGASSGRGVVGTLVESRMELSEVHRFRTPMLERNGHLHWDIGALWSDVRTCLERALRLAPQLQSVSVDSWAVDYVALDAQHVPICDPFSYRDTRTNGRLDDVFRVIPADRLYRLTGTQFLPFNTLSQVVADLADDPSGTARVAHRLLIADYLLYRLSGVMRAERTMASTTQLFDVTALLWADEVIAAIGDDRSRYPEIVAPGAMLGSLQDGVLDSESARPAVIATCSHDTAAAVAAAPAVEGEAWAYISSGTWSLVGAELTLPVLTNGARLAGFTNEIGIDGTIRFLKNRNGLWVLEECLREWATAGDQPTWDTVFADAASAPSGAGSIDLNAPQFAERGDMVAKIRAACVSAGIVIPQSRGALVRLVLESLASSYAATLDELESLTGERASVIHVFGGGARNALLNQLTADACGRRVIAGPVEATVLGNLLLQARALGALPPGALLRDIVRRSATLTEFTPQHAPSGRTAVIVAR